GTGITYPKWGTQTYVAPEVAMATANNAIVGLPSVLAGTPGYSGNALCGAPAASWGVANANAATNWGALTGILVAGGAGGASGAGLLVVSKGAAFGVNGKIDTSGADAPVPGSVVVSGRTFYAGRGSGGAPGAVYWVMVGENATPPSLEGKAFAYWGEGRASL